MKAYSVDLRQKIIDVYNEGNLSQRQLAKQFHVAKSFVQKLLKQYRETGNIAPLKRKKQTPTKLNLTQLKVLEELVKNNNDATLEELRDQFIATTGIIISRSTVDRMLHRFNLTFKKKHCIQPKKGVKKSNSKD